MDSKFQALSASTLIGLTTVAAFAKQSDSELNTSSHVARFEGPLSGVEPPATDGPILWGRRELGRGTLAAVGGTAGMGLALFLGLCTSQAAKDRRAFLTAAAACGGLAGAGMGAACGQDVREISFETKISQILVSETPHEERVGARTSGPYYSQLVLIPECSIPLQSKLYRVPLADEQKIFATFQIDSHNRITSWVAKPATR